MSEASEQQNDISSTQNGDSAASEHATSEPNGELTNGSSQDVSAKDGEADEAAQPPENVFQLTIKLPHPPEQTQVMVSTQEQVQDVRQSVIDTPHTFQYSCFHLEHNGKRVNDFVELSEVPNIVEEPELALVEDPYTEAQARMHIIRIRELIGAAGDRTDLVMGIDAGASLCEGVEVANGKSEDDSSSPLSDYNVEAPATVSALIAKPRETAPKTIKSMALSSWNPPPYHLRMRGHLLYLQVTTNEGEQYYVTSSVSGFYVNRSTNNKFDPSPRSSPKSFSAHSFLTLLAQISPSFDASFKRLHEYNSQRDPLASYQLSNTIPSAPWLVSPNSVQQHVPDPMRTQEPFLLAGAENTDTLRDWNEEFQSTRELPKESVQDRVFRERLTSKLFAEYNEAAIRGAVLVARGEVQPLNPTEGRDAQIFVYNNVFYSFGADGVGTFTTDGGDEAARIATGKDVQGVKAVNQLDINGLFTAATVVVDYLGKRIVGQSIVPGIFKQREPGEHQIDYGGVEGKDVIATLDSFVQPFSELSKAMRVKRHAVWDKEGKKHELEGSVETKGLLGTDGRKYVLDLYRLTPLDISWIERHRGDDQEGAKSYPHRMTVLRPELVEHYRISKLREYISKEVEKKRANRSVPQTNGEVDHSSSGAVEKDGKEQANGDIAKDEKIEQSTKLPNGEATANGETPVNGEITTNGETTANGDEPKEQSQQQELVDVSGFQFALNSDVFSGQQPQTDDEKAEWEADEVEVRAVCEYLTADVVPRTVRELSESDVGFPMDGQSLSRDMHKRGINVRYLGEIAQLAEKHAAGRSKALVQLCKQEMVSRAFKHFANVQMKGLPPCFAQSCISHLLNCLLGTELNPTPSPDVDEELKTMYPEVEFGFEKVTPSSMREELTRQVALRYRYQLDEDLFVPGKQLQLLREVALKLGLQLEAKEYQFGISAAVSKVNGTEEKHSDSTLALPQTNGVHPPAEGGKKKKKKQADSSPQRAASASPTSPPTTFHPDNVLNIVPLVKEASPRSVLAEEALDAGRVSIQQDQKELGQELLLESLSLHEQIYGILHPEVARVYYALSTMYWSMDEKKAALELAKKAVIVSERTLGIDNGETILAYLNLSLYEHASGNTQKALAYVRHALELWKVVYGVRHPDSITTLNNAAVMLQSLKLFHDSRVWFEASLDICREYMGEHTVAVATLLFQLAQALALDQDAKAAVTKMRESYTIFKSQLGADNVNTREASQWLETLTQNAVSQAKQANALMQNRKLLLRGGRVSRTVGTRPPPHAGHLPSPVASGTATTRGIDQRSLDELLKYINGEGNQTTPKKRPTNPKRR